VGWECLYFVFIMRHDGLFSDGMVSYVLLRRVMLESMG
jgi:hypothetical protein